jgi:hypothetical protein
MTAEENYRLLCEIEANRAMLLQAYRQNPRLLAHAEERIRLIFNGGAAQQPDVDTRDSGSPASNAR